MTEPLTRLIILACILFAVVDDVGASQLVGKWSGIYEVAPHTMGVKLTVSRIDGDKLLGELTMGQPLGKTRYLNALPQRGTVSFIGTIADEDELGIFEAQNASAALGMSGFTLVWNRGEKLLAGTVQRTQGSSGSPFILFAKGRDIRSAQRTIAAVSDTQGPKPMPQLRRQTSRQKIQEIRGLLSRQRRGPSANSLREWARSLTEAYPYLDLRHEGAWTKTRRLFSDDLFVPVFGEPYAKMIAAEKSSVHRDLQTVITQIEGRDPKLAATLELLLPYFLKHNNRRSTDAALAAMVIPQLETWRDRRLASTVEHEDLDRSRLINQINRLETLASRGEEVLEWLWPHERSNFLRTVRTWKETTVGTLATIRTNELLNNIGHDLDDARELDEAVTLASSTRRIEPLTGTVGPLLANADAETREALVARLSAKRDAILRDVVATRLNAVEGESGRSLSLAESRERYRELIIRFRPFLEDSHVERLRQALAAQRGESLEAQKETVAGRIAAATTVDEVNSIVYRDLNSPIDKVDDTGSALLALAESRVKTILAEEEARKQALAAAERKRLEERRIARSRRVDIPPSPNLMTGYESVTVCNRMPTAVFYARYRESSSLFSGLSGEIKASWELPPGGCHEMNPGRSILDGGERDYQKVKLYFWEFDSSGARNILKFSFRARGNPTALMKDVCLFEEKATTGYLNADNRSLFIDTFSPPCASDMFRVKATVLIQLGDLPISLNLTR